MEQKYLTSFKSAERALKVADHLAYVTYPLIKENKICLQIISELNIFSIYIINSILQYEYYFKNIQLYSNPKDNLETFRSQCVPKYGFSDNEIKVLFEVMRLAEAHKKSPMEFVKDMNVVIMTDSMRTEIMNIDKVKGFIRELKGFLEKIRLRLSQNRLVG